ncbi:MAG: DUF1080 domain-containing protein [Chloroflexi bacterium]|nr:DUF1080 domain-containing protein [Chloroflexota bacterium]
MKRISPLFLFISLLVIVGLACSVSGGGEATAPPAQEQPAELPQATAVPTEVPPTVAPSPTLVPTEPPNLQFFKEEFDQDPKWKYFLTHGDEDEAEVTFEDGLMVFNLTDTGIYAYYLYEGFEYDDVRLDIRAENRGKNNNNVSLVCRHTDEGWYEFSTEGGGIWYLLAGHIGGNGNVNYDTLVSGGALSLKQGKEVNEYRMICQGNEIRLYINDVEVKTLKENKYSFRKGKVGFNISSLNVYPIILEVDWFEISEP